MHRGYIKLWRKLMDSDMWKELSGVQRELLFICLMKAGYKKREVVWRGKTETLLPGQFKTSLTNLQSLMSKGIGIKAIRGALRGMERHQFLAQSGTQYGTVITICNWDTYQAEPETEDTVMDTVQDTERAQLGASNKKSKEEENKSNPPIVPPSGGTSDRCPYQEIQRLYQEICVPAGLPDVRVLSVKRKRIIRSGWKDVAGDMQIIRDAMKGAAMSDYYREKRYGIDTVFRHIPENAEKVGANPAAKQINFFNPNNRDTETREA